MEKKLIKRKKGALFARLEFLGEFMKRKLLSLTLAILMTFLIAACDKPQEKHSESFEAMDTYMQLTVYGDKAAVQKIRDRVCELDKLLSSTDPDSDIYALNKNGSATVDESTAEALIKSVQLSRSTGGALDITVYPIVEEWGFINKDYKIPDSAALSKLLETVDSSAIGIKNTSVVLNKGGKVGLGAVAKGFAADEAIDILEDSDSKGAILNLGGTVVAYGSKNGDSWKIGIADPENSADYMGYFTCKDKVIATSGSYERYFKGEDGKTYSHIIDPKTGRPVDNGIRSVTIICDSGFRADGLSTALFVMGREKAEEYHRLHNNVDYVILTDDNKAYVTKGSEKSFSVAKGHDYAVKVVE